MLNPLKRPLKLYLDTSIPNFLFADEAQEEQKITQALFSQKFQNQYEFYISGVVLREIERAPAEKRGRLLEKLQNIEALNFSEEAETLATAYLKAGALPKASAEDARHVAVATVDNLDAVVSWNFKHLVNLRRVKAINLVNEQMGYKHMVIVSPREVIQL